MFPIRCAWVLHSGPKVMRLTVSWECCPHLGEGGVGRSQLTNVLAEINDTSSRKKEMPRRCRNQKEVKKKPRGSSLVAQRVTDPVLPHLWHRLQLWHQFCSWPRNLHIPRVWPEKKKKRSEKTKENWKQALALGLHAGLLSCVYRYGWSLLGWHGESSWTFLPGQAFCKYLVF